MLPCYVNVSYVLNPQLKKGPKHFTTKLKSLYRGHTLFILYLNFSLLAVFDYLQIYKTNITFII